MPPRKPKPKRTELSDLEIEHEIYRGQTLRLRMDALCRDYPPRVVLACLCAIHEVYLRENPELDRNGRRRAVAHLRGDV